MEDNDLHKQEEKSLLKDMAKKGISTTIKSMPPKSKLKLYCIIAGTVLFLLMFIVLTVSIFMLLFNDEFIEIGSLSDLVYTETTSVDNYWWPIGGDNITIIEEEEFALGAPSTNRITSYYNPSRDLYYDSDGDRVEEKHTKAHNAIDIGRDLEKGYDWTYYVIATASGVVTTVKTGCNNSGFPGNTCNGGYGNYIIIEHSGGVYSTYAHLNPKGIKVQQGDVVKQGQIIGIMGNSGSSEALHLHFEIKVNGTKINPLENVSPETPRPITVISGTENTATPDSGSSSPQTQQQIQLLQMLHSWEGTGPTSGDYYIVYADSGGVLTVGHGVTLINNAGEFSERGIDASKLFKGSKVKKSIVDDIEQEIVNNKKNSVLSLLKNNGITLEDYQVDALVSRMYNIGNVGGFPEKYKQYGNTQELYNYYMSKPVTDINGTYLLGLERRRQAEWKLFNTGIYTFNS